MKANPRIAHCLCLPGLQKSPILPALLLLCATLLSACGNDAPPLPRLSDDAVILAFGDSLTFGTGAASTESYPAQLQQLTGRRVINAGVPGEVSAAGVRRLPGLLDRHQPALLVLCHGGNDILRGLSRRALRQNLDNMIRLARQRNIAVVLLAVPEFGLFLQAAEVYAELARSHNIPLQNDALPDILQRASLKADQVHHNGKGYRKLAQSLATLLQDAGAI